ncbi:MAG: hypothetical protein M1457_05235 [bacterium]|nr:hypothetical protein [bacterium]
MRSRKLTMVVLMMFGVAFGGVAKSVTAEEKMSPNSGMKTPEVWMAILPADVMVEPGAQWDFVKKHVDGMKFWTQQIDLEARQWPFQGKVDAPGALKKLIDVLNENKIDIIIEKGAWPPVTGAGRGGSTGMGGAAGPFDETYSQRAADNEIARLKKMEGLGGKVRYLDVDGPIRHMLHNAKLPPTAENIDRCAAQFTDYMMRIHKVFPEVEFFALTNFPNWGYKGDVAYWGNEGWGDYRLALEAIVRHAKAAGAPLAGFTIDNPYDYAIGEVPSPGLKDPTKIDWIARILDMEKYVHEHGLKYNVIFNCQRGGAKSAELFRKESLAFIDLYHKRGGRPDIYIMQSWYTHPDRTEIVPESDPNSFTGLIKDAIIKVKGIKE